MKRIGTARRKTRHMYTKPMRQAGKLSISKFFQQFDEGARVVLKAEPAYQKGIYFRRFHGRVGTVCGKQGNCYKVTINDKSKEKTVLVHPVHLRAQ